MSDEEITERFDADRLRGRPTADQCTAGTALTAVLETLAGMDLVSEVAADALERLS